VRECTAAKRSQHDENQKQRDEYFAPPEESRKKRKKQVEHFLHGKRPENIPGSREISAPSFQHIQVKRKRGQQRSSEPSRLWLYDEILDLCEMKQTQNGE
jgi:hypothetical protein